MTQVLADGAAFALWGQEQYITDAACKHACLTASDQSCYCMSDFCVASTCVCVSGFMADAACIDSDASLATGLTYTDRL